METLPSLRILRKLPLYVPGILKLQKRNRRRESRSRNLHSPRSRRCSHRLRLPPRRFLFHHLPLCRCPLYPPLAQQTTTHLGMRSQRRVISWRPTRSTRA